MGDTGSLFLGGAVCGLAFAFDMPLILILVGIVYIAETLSDIIQVVYFKATHGKRIFRMAPFTSLRNGGVEREKGGGGVRTGIPGVLRRGVPRRFEPLSGMIPTSLERQVTYGP